MNPPSDQNSNAFSEWLEKLQQESWQLELLISGLALFGIWSSQHMLHRLEYYLDVNLIREFVSYGNVILALLWSGWIIFLTNLVIHIVVRGLWIGAIGLRYVSGDIDWDTLNYSEIFTQYYKRKIGSFDNYIERLEKMSSVLFSFTFLLFFMFLSFAAFNLVFVIITRLFTFMSPDTSESNLGMIALAYYGIGLIVLIDFFTLGAFKKVKDKGFSRVYFWIYRFYSTISVSVIFRPLLLNFIDNRYTRRLFYLAFPYAILILVGARGVSFEKNVFIPDFNPKAEYSHLVGAASINWLYYDDLREAHINAFNNGNELPEKTKIHFLSLDQYENDDNSLAVFLEFRNNDDLHLQEKLGFSPFRKKGIIHRLFSHGSEKDPTIVRLDSIYLSTITLMKNIITDPQYNVTDEVLSRYPQQIALWKQKTKEDISMLRDKLALELQEEKSKYFESKLKAIKEEIVNMYTFEINGNIVHTDQSYFATHPNIHERGVVAYFSLDSLAIGNHLLKVTKQRQYEDCKNGCLPSVFSIPFRKI